MEIPGCDSCTKTEKAGHWPAFDYLLLHVEYIKKKSFVTSNCSDIL